MVIENKSKLVLRIGFLTAFIFILSPMIQAEDQIIPPVVNFNFNARWSNPKMAGKSFWYAISARPNFAQLFDIERCAWVTWGNPDVQTKQLADALVKKASSVLMSDPAIGGNPEQAKSFNFLQNRFFKLFIGGKIPLTSFGDCRRVWDGKNQVLRWSNMPSPEEISALKANPNIVGLLAYPEWGNTLIGAVQSQASSAKLPDWLVSLRAATVPQKPKTRQEFACAAKRFWDALQKPFDYQGEGHDGTYYWAIQWPALLGARSIITENRYGGRSNTLFQAFTRAAGRMGNIPWGYSPGATCDVSWGVGPSYSSIGPTETDQLSRGQGLFSINCMQRLFYYWCMGDAAIIRDEQNFRMITDPEKDGNYHLTNYGHIVKDIMDFSERYADRGTPYTPIGILLAWDNGFTTGIYAKKSFACFDYNDGEYMTAELFGRVLYPTEERWGNGRAIMDIFGTSPYGDIYDPLRIDTPKGPLPMELLENYKVLITAGHQNIDNEVALRLEEYVKQGGVLILNVKQVVGTPLDNKSFLGVELNERVSTATQVHCLLDGKKLNSGEFSYTPLTLIDKSVALYSVINGDTLVARHQFGKGYVITVGAHWMLENKKTDIKPGEKRAQILPLANDMIKRLVKAVLPFEIYGEHVQERVLYQANRKDHGWVISLYNNSGREASTNSTEKIWYDHKVEVGIKISPEIRHAVEWLSRDRLGILRENADSVGILQIALDPGEVRIVEIQENDIPPLKVLEHVNLALNCPVKASSSNKETIYNKRVHGPELAVNGNRNIFDAWWSKEHANSDSHPWLEVDLGEIKEINSINTIFMWSEENSTLPRIYQYYVEGSTDGKNWEKVFDESKNMLPAHPNGDQRYFDPVEARYVRITVTANTALGGAQIVEFEVYGDKKAEKTYNWLKTPPLKKNTSRIDFPEEIKKAVNIKYLSEIEPRYWEQGYKHLLMDKETMFGGPLCIKGEKFRKGLGTHAYSEITYDLSAIPGKWKYFAAQVGVDDSAAPEGSVDFVIFLDKKEKARTGRIKSGETSFPLWVYLGNTKELKLVVEDCGDGVIGDIADWGDAKLTN